MIRLQEEEGTPFTAIREGERSRGVGSQAQRLLCRPLELGDGEKIKCPDIFDQIPRYCGDIVGLTIGAFTKYAHNDIFDE